MSMVAGGLRTAARILTGSTYAVLGFDALRAPGARVDQAAPTLAALRKVALQRISALALAASLVPTTAAGHAFWAVEDPSARKQQRIQFHKNMAMIGGLLFAVCDGRAEPARRAPVAPSSPTTTGS
jgi:hypothetical protein